MDRSFTPENILFNYTRHMNFFPLRDMHNIRTTRIKMSRYLELFETGLLEYSDYLTFFTFSFGWLLMSLYIRYPDISSRSDLFGSIVNIHNGVVNDCTNLTIRFIYDFRLTSRSEIERFLLHQKSYMFDRRYNRNFVRPDVWIDINSQHLSRLSNFLYEDSVHWCEDFSLNSNLTRIELRDLCQIRIDINLIESLNNKDDLADLLNDDFLKDALIECGQAFFELHGIHMR